MQNSLPLPALPLSCLNTKYPRGNAIAGALFARPTALRARDYIFALFRAGRTWRRRRQEEDGGGGVGVTRRAPHDLTPAERLERRVEVAKRYPSTLT